MSGSREASDGFLSHAELADRQVLVIGLGISGRAVARALRGLGASVKATESSPDAAGHPEVEALAADGVEIEVGRHKKAMKWMDHADLVIPSPGVSPKTSVLSHAIAQGLPVLSEIEVASRFTSKPIAAVTGTNGKTTTCRLLGSMLRADGRDAVVCGNIGNPFISAAIDHPDADAFVVEVSSFQLTFCYAFHPQVAVVTNFAPDHLDWHGTMDAYKVAKGRIAARQMQRDHFVYPADQPELAGLAPVPGPRKVPFSMGVIRTGDGVWLDQRGIVARIGSDVVTPVGPAEHLARFGRPTVEDGLAATAAALSMEVEPESVARAVESFEPDHHRIEPVGERDGVAWVDDSKATNPHATLAALRCFDNIVLIAGGRNKGLNLTDLRSEARRLRGVVGLGEAAGDVAKAFEGTDVPVRKAADMAAAVQAAAQMAVPGSVVLLSPACSSFDQFRDYGHRGEVFRACVQAMIGEPS